MWGMVELNHLSSVYKTAASTVMLMPQAPEGLLFFLVLVLLLGLAPEVDSEVVLVVKALIASAVSATEIDGLVTVGASNLARVVVIR